MLKTTHLEEGIFKLLNTAPENNLLLNISTFKQELKVEECS
jgi:hypothetical protein